MLDEQMAVIMKYVDDGDAVMVEMLKEAKIYAKTLTKNLVLSNNTIKRFTLTLKSSQLLQNEIMPTMLLGIS